MPGILRFVSMLSDIKKKKKKEQKIALGLFVSILFLIFEKSK